ncbi:low molecular weight phosphatase family protein [Microbacterium caowuchunii]|uniref:arsenate reductase/protein-tyrosine-phosphatase family protein n=1 Tax=Microbacterium caowuchunii TaxID=2614638 RepID=UPI0012459F90|nr:low molecular weight phosphatase family protein [Microbacterium caowuchunii]QEW00830.1 low molecular weight phosphatase family protein [Microbacterium caowuchunii]
MITVLTVCTGNICRSPFAEVILQDELGARGVRVASAGVRALIDDPMTPEAQQLARQYGVPEELISGHRARWLNESHLVEPDLILAMTREHRRAVVELTPAQVRRTFTVRELARLAQHVPDEEARRIADAAGSDPAARLAALLTHLTGVRGELDPPAEPGEDDVVDPYRRSWAVYEQMAAEMMPALGEVVRILTLATDPPTAH